MWCGALSVYQTLIKPFKPWLFVVTIKGLTLGKWNESVYLLKMKESIQPCLYIGLHRNMYKHMQTINLKAQE